jgi:hypothetical protein
MRSLLLGFGTSIVGLAGTAAVLGLTRLVLVQVRGVRRLSQQISDPDDRAGLPWEFTDCGQPPGWLLPPAPDQPPQLPAVREWS